MFSEQEVREMCRRAGLSEEQTERRLASARPAPPGPELAERAKRGHKFGAVPVTLETGERFDSSGEHGRWQELRQLERAGEILHLTRDRQKLTFPLMVGDIKIADYIADFAYTDPVTGERVIEDFKGMVTPVYRMKEKLMLAIYGIQVRRETAKGQRRG